MRKCLARCNHPQNFKLVKYREPLIRFRSGRADKDEQTSPCFTLCFLTVTSAHQYLTLEIILLLLKIIIVMSLLQRPAADK